MFKKRGWILLTISLLFSLLMLGIWQYTSGYMKNVLDQTQKTCTQYQWDCTIEGQSITAWVSDLQTNGYSKLLVFKGELGFKIDQIQITNKMGEHLGIEQIMLGVNPISVVHEPLLKLKLIGLRGSVLIDPKGKQISVLGQSIKPQANGQDAWMGLAVSFDNASIELKDVLGQSVNLVVEGGFHGSTQQLTIVDAVKKDTNQLSVWNRGSWGQVMGVIDTIGPLENSRMHVKLKAKNIDPIIIEWLRAWDLLANQKELLALVSQELMLDMQVNKTKEKSVGALLLKTSITNDQVKKIINELPFGVSKRLPLKKLWPTEGPDRVQSVELQIPEISFQAHENRLENVLIKINKFTVGAKSLMGSSSVRIGQWHMQAAEPLAIEERLKDLVFQTEQIDLAWLDTLNLGIHLKAQGAGLLTCKKNHWQHCSLEAKAIGNKAVELTGPGLNIIGTGDIKVVKSTDTMGFDIQLSQWQPKNLHVMDYQGAQALTMGRVNGKLGIDLDKFGFVNKVLFEASWKEHGRLQWVKERLKNQNHDEQRLDVRIDWDSLKKQNPLSMKIQGSLGQMLLEQSVEGVKGIEQAKWYEALKKYVDHLKNVSGQLVYQGPMRINPELIALNLRADQLSLKKQQVYQINQVDVQLKQMQLRGSAKQINFDNQRLTDVSISKSFKNAEPMQWEITAGQFDLAWLREQTNGFVLWDFINPTLGGTGVLGRANGLFNESSESINILNGTGQIVFKNLMHPVFKSAAEGNVLLSVENEKLQLQAANFQWPEASIRLENGKIEGLVQSMQWLEGSLLKQLFPDALLTGSLSVQGDFRNDLRDLKIALVGQAGALGSSQIINEPLHPVYFKVNKSNELWQMDGYWNKHLNVQGYWNKGIYIKALDPNYQSGFNKSPSWEHQNINQFEFVLADPWIRELCRVQQVQSARLLAKNEVIKKQLIDPVSDLLKRLNAPLVHVQWLGEKEDCFGLQVANQRWEITPTGTGWHLIDQAKRLEIKNSQKDWEILINDQQINIPAKLLEPLTVKPMQPRDQKALEGLKNGWEALERLDAKTIDIKIKKLTVNQSNQNQIMINGGLYLQKPHNNIKALTGKLASPQIGQLQLEIMQTQSGYQMQGQLGLDSVQKLFAYLNQEPVVWGTKADVSFDFQTIAPWDYYSFKGPMRVRLSEGRFLKAQSVAAKLLGLFSLQNLTRRIKLNFKDVFAEGFEFTQALGYFDWDNERIAIKQWELVGPQAKVQLSGRIDLQKQNIDANMIIYPSPGILSDSLYYALMSINPVGGLMAYLGTESRASDLIAQLFKLSYNITGSLSEPILTNTGNPNTQNAGGGVLSDESR